MCVCVYSAEGLVNKFSCTLDNGMKFNVIQQECPTPLPGAKHSIVYGASLKIEVTPRGRRLRTSFQTSTGLLGYSSVLLTALCFCLFFWFSP